MLRSFEMYRRFIGIRIRGQMQYRTAFVIDVLSVAVMSATGIVTLALVLERFESIGGWNLAELAFLYGMVETSFGIMDMVFAGFDPDVFSVKVRRGEFDQVLLRPVGITLQVLGSEFVLRRVGRILQGGAILLVAAQLADITWTLPKMLYFPFVMGGMVLFFGGIFIIGATITFWTLERIEAVNIFTYGGSEMMSYPMHIYPDLLRDLFTYIVPGIFLNYYPAIYFLGKPDPLGMPAFAPFLAPAVGFAVLAAALLFWRVGLNHYQSSGT